MDKNIENRFGYLKEKNQEQLREIRKEIQEDSEYLLTLIEKNKVSSEQISESKRDLQYNKEVLNYISSLLPPENIKKR